MNLQEAIKILKEYVSNTKDHSCNEEGDEYGIYPCCGEVDYRPHKADCIHNKVEEAIKLVENRIEIIRGLAEKIIANNSQEIK